MQWEPTAADPVTTNSPGLSYRRMGDQASYCRMGEASAVDSGSCIFEAVYGVQIIFKYFDVYH